MHKPSASTNNPGHVSHAPHFIGPALTFITGIILTVTVFSLVRHWEESQLQSLFELSARNRFASLQTDVIRHQGVVDSIASLFSSSQQVTRKEFRLFVASALARQPSIQALSWNPLIKNAERDDYIKKAHEDNLADFEITHFDTGGQLEENTSRDDAVVVYYIEPYLGNEKAMGFNIASHPGRLKAIQQARDTGKSVITERVALVQKDTAKQNLGYLLLKAVYRQGESIDTLAERRKHFLGVVVGVIRFQNWSTYAMQNLPRAGLDVLIMDKSAPMDKQFLHFHSSRTRNVVLTPTLQNLNHATEGLHWQTTVDVLGRQWSFLFTPAPAFLATHRSWQAWTILLAGLSFTFLLTFYLFATARHTSRMLSTNIALLHEVTERKTNESELKAQIDFIDTVLNAAGNIIVVLDLEGRFVRFNRAAEELTGYSIDDVLDKPVWELVIPDEQKNRVKSVFNQLKNGDIEVTRQYENEWLTNDGGRCLLQWHNSALRDEHGKVSHIVAMGYDITEKKKAAVEHERLQRELQQAHKMDSLGQLTGGIAHDFNNLLGVINGYANLIIEKYQTRADEKLLNYVNHIKEAGERAAKLVTQMLAFSRSAQLDDTPIQLEPLLKEDVKMLRATLPSTVEIKTSIESSLPSVLMNPIHLHQILMNLAINARDAMREVGQLSIKLGWARKLDTESQISHKPVSGDWIELSVSDTGTGIDTETARNMFNPFFTTKEVGKGTGMGLSVIYGIMESHEGHILLESELGKGSTFRILFPPTPGDNHEITQDNQKTTSLTKGNGAEILLVDDELSLGNFMVELVTHHGYNALLITDSAEAFTLFQKQPDRFSMLITDQTMPGMTGMALIKKIRELRPGLPVILCSGNVDRINDREMMEMNIAIFEKPIAGQQLLLKIAELLKN